MFQTKEEKQGSIQFDLTLWIPTTFDTHGNGALANSFLTSEEDKAETSSQQFGIGIKQTSGNNIITIIFKKKTDGYGNKQQLT